MQKRYTLLITLLAFIGIGASVIAGVDGLAVAMLVVGGIGLLLYPFLVDVFRL